MTLKRRSPLRRTGIKRSPSANKPSPRRSSAEFSDKTRSRARNRQSGRCALCERPVEQYHHRKMRSQGGLGTVENCLPVCAEHHATIHANPTWAYRHGLLVRRNVDPAHVMTHRLCDVDCTKDHVGDSATGP